MIRRMRGACLPLACFLLLWTCVASSPTPTGSSVVVVPAEDATSTTAGPQDSKPKESLKEADPSLLLLKPRITSMKVESNVTLRYATTLVTSRVANPASKANEVTFSMVIPETAFITGFSMEMDGKVYDAYVEEKVQAKKVYDTAISSGMSAAHVAVQARDSNHFTVSVNVEPQKKAIFRLTYEELLSRRLGLYSLVMNLHPGQLLDELAVEVDITEERPIRGLTVPEMRTGNEIDDMPTDSNNKFSTHELSEDKLHAKVRFSPNKEQQMELMKLFREKEKEKEKKSSITSYLGNPEYAQKPEEEGVSGQFVVQYDVDRDLKGEVLVNDGYFVHFFAPKDLKPLNKHVIFVLDVSGSMVGRKISQLKEAMVSILQDLKPGDYFSIMDFAYSAKVYNLDDPTKNAIYRTGSYHNFYGDEEPVGREQPEVPPPAKRATPENIEKAKQIINNLNASGGTNIYDALVTALKVANYSVQAAAESQLNEKISRPEPMIIFLTDGDPTVGETSTEKILSAVTEFNPKKTAIFSLAFGEDADRTFLRRVSLKNHGFMRHIYEAADSALQLGQFYQQVASPLLTNVSYVYPDDQVDETTLTKKSFNYFFSGSELLVIGKLKKEPSGASPVKLVADSFDGPIDFIPVVPTEETHKTRFWPLERMWAFLTIKQLLDERDARGDKPNDETQSEPTKKALALALKYSFVTPLTSLVVVKPNSTSAVDAESVQAGGGEVYNQALPLYIGGAQPLVGQSNFALSLPMFSPQMPFSNYHKLAPINPTAFDSLSTRADNVQSLLLEMDEVDSDSLSSDNESKDDRISNHSSTTNQPIDNKTFEGKDSINEPLNSTSRLEKYGLEKYAWLEDYLDTVQNVITFVADPASNEIASYKLRLKEELSSVDESGVPTPCPASVTGGVGMCRYLSSCPEMDANVKDFTTYRKFSCDAKGFAGVCCTARAP